MSAFGLCSLGVVTATIAQRTGAATAAAAMPFARRELAGKPIARPPPPNPLPRALSPSPTPALVIKHPKAARPVSPQPQPADESPTVRTSPLGTRLGARSRPTVQEQRYRQQLQHLQHDVDTLRSARGLDALRIARLQEELPVLQRSVQEHSERAEEWKAAHERSERARLAAEALVQAQAAELSQLRERVVGDARQLQQQAEAHRADTERLQEDTTAQRVAIERLTRAKAARDQRLGVLLVERNRLAQLLALARVEEKEQEEQRRESEEWRSVDDRSTLSAGKRQSAGSIVHGRLPEEGGRASVESAARTHAAAASRNILSPLTPNSQTLPRGRMAPSSHTKVTSASKLRPATTPRPPTSPSLVDSAQSVVEEQLVPPIISPALLHEEAALARMTSERLKKQLALMEDKCRELERGCAALTTDNRDLTLRFKHAVEARHRVEKKLRAVEAELTAAITPSSRTGEAYVGWAR